MPEDLGAESALLIAVPAAEAVVSAHRQRHDPAARVGVPAHLTVAYPFTPVDLLTESDLEALRGLFAGFPAFEVTLSSTGWFGDEVLFLDPDEQGRLLALIDAVGDAFPDHPIYGGIHPDVHAHVTVGDGAGREVLAAVEREVRQHLPLRQRVEAVELWQGPPPRSGRGRWSLVTAFPLGPAHP